MHDDLRGADALARPDLTHSDSFTRFRLDARWAVALVAIAGAVAVVVVARTRPEVAMPPSVPSALSSATTFTPSGGDAAAAGGATSSTGNSIDATTPSTVVVHVTGAVRSPGVVHLPVGARATDAIDAVGGAGPRADLAALNLAAVLADGQQVRVPRRGEQRNGTGATAGTPADGATTPGGPTAGTGADAEPTPDTPLALNSATAEELETLPGIGPSLAAAIVAERDRLGGFASVDDLLRVRGIGDQRLADLRPLVVL